MSYVILGLANNLWWLLLSRVPGFRLDEVTSALFGGEPLLDAYLTLL